ncbi:uncharacterized protein DS421_12g375760 [Arachis hypogaea]|nr:uncharacterized protein DS421_12g375760 [Arachis hypogaea]
MNNHQYSPSHPLWYQQVLTLKMVMIKYTSLVTQNMLYMVRSCCWFLSCFSPLSFFLLCLFTPGDFVLITSSHTTMVVLRWSLAHKCLEQLATHSSFSFFFYIFLPPKILIIPCC